MATPVRRQPDSLAVWTQIALILRKIGDARQPCTPQQALAALAAKNSRTAPVVPVVPASELKFQLISPIL